MGTLISIPNLKGNIYNISLLNILTEEFLETLVLQYFDYYFTVFWLFFFINLFIYFYFWLHWVFVAACGLFSSCGEQGLLFVAVRGLLIAVASLAAEHKRGLQ